MVLVRSCLRSGIGPSFRRKFLLNTARGHKMADTWPLSKQKIRIMSLFPKLNIKLSINPNTNLSFSHSIG